MISCYKFKRKTLRHLSIASIFFFFCIVWLHCYDSFSDSEWRQWNEEVKWPNQLSQIPWHCWMAKVLKIIKKKLLSKRLRLLDDQGKRNIFAFLLFLSLLPIYDWNFSSMMPWVWLRNSVLAWQLWNEIDSIRKIRKNWKKETGKIDSTAG